MGKVIEKIDVKSGVGIFRYFEHLDLKSWYLIAEYVDNAIGSYQDHKEELNRIHKKLYKKSFQLKVRIYRDQDNKTITITDNIKVCSFNNNAKKAKSGKTLELIDTATKPLKPIKKTIGIIIKNEAIKLFFSTLLF